MSSYYNRLYFFAVGKDYLDFVEQIQELDLNVLPAYEGGETDLLSDFDGNSRARFLSLKPMTEVREDIGGGYTPATYDVISWARGYIYKDQQLIMHWIDQSLPPFDRPNPTAEHLIKFEDARALRKTVDALRCWMKKNWVDHDGDGVFFGPEALRLHLEEGYEYGTIEFDNIPPTTYNYPDGKKLTVIK